MASRLIVRDVEAGYGAVKGADPAAICPAGMLVGVQLHSERLAEILHRAGQKHGAAAAAFADYIKAVLSRKRPNLGEVRILRAVGGGKRFASEVLALPRRSGAHLLRGLEGCRTGAAPDGDGDLNFLIGISGPDQARAAHGGTPAVL